MIYGTGQLLVRWKNNGKSQDILVVWLSLGKTIYYYFTLHNTIKQMNRISELFSDKKIVDKIQRRLPKLFHLAELESSRAGN